MAKYVCVCMVCIDERMGSSIGLPEIGEPFGSWLYFEIWVTDVNQYEGRDDTSRHLCRHRRKIPYFILKYLFLISLDTDPHLASVVCVPLSLFRFEIRVVCVWELVYVCACEHKFGVATNHGKF
jgi:hypothetical protein